MHALRALVVRLHRSASVALPLRCARAQRVAAAFVPLSPPGAPRSALPRRRPQPLRDGIPALCASCRRRPPARRAGVSSRPRATRQKLGDFLRNSATATRRAAGSATRAWPTPCPSLHFSDGQWTAPTTAAPPCVHPVSSRRWGGCARTPRRGEVARRRRRSPTRYQGQIDVPGSGVACAGVDPCCCCPQRAAVMGAARERRRTAGTGWFVGACTPDWPSTPPPLPTGLRPVRVNCTPRRRHRLRTLNKSRASRPSRWFPVSALLRAQQVASTIASSPCPRRRRGSGSRTTLQRRRHHTPGHGLPRRACRRWAAPLADLRRCLGEAGRSPRAAIHPRRSASAARRRRHRPAVGT